MGLNQGIQKYRESAKALSKAKKSATETGADPDKNHDKIEKTLKAAKKEKVAEAQKVETSAKVKAAAAKAVVAKGVAKAVVAKTPAKAAATAKTATAAKTVANGKAAVVAKGAVPAKAAAKTATKTHAKTAAVAAKSRRDSEETEHEEESAEAGEEQLLDSPDGEVVEEEVELQKELEEEIKADAVQTSSLVKEDYSPVNSTRDRLVVEYAPLIKYIAQKIAARLPTNIELDDLISSGVIGLMDAIEKYDASRDNKFKTYAEFRIRGAILDELRAQDWVPRSVREKAKALERCYARIEQQKGRQATDEEICSELGVSQEEYHEMLSQVRSVSLLSFDDVQNFSKADKRALHGFSDASNYKSPTPYSEVNHAALKRMISEAINDLPEKQRLVLSLYYYEDLNLKEIGRVLDVTESRVSQLHTQAILRLKGKLRNHWDEFVTLIAGGGL
jgi:RNA polymerase sigma factor for flagellar operon FliA